MEIGIDPEGRLYVRPAKATFELIYRAAMEVHWDGPERRPFSPKPRKTTYPQWFRQILDAAADEYGIKLNITEKTNWSNVPDAIKSEIEASCLQKA